MDREEGVNKDMARFYLKHWGFWLETTQHEWSAAVCQCAECVSLRLSHEELKHIAYKLDEEITGAAPIKSDDTPVPDTLEEMFRK